MKRLLAAIVACLPFASRAADQDPLDYPVRQYGFMLGVALLGGLVSWIAKVRAGQASAYNVMQLVGELATSAFAGLIAFWICAWAGTPGPLTAALVGVSGHMGTRAIGLFETWAEKRFGGLVGGVSRDQQP
jgi:hypothetical protein